MRGMGDVAAEATPGVMSLFATVAVVVAVAAVVAWTEEEISSAVAEEAVVTSS